MLTINATIITAWSTVILSIITFFYVIFTYKILKEQKKSIKIAALEKILENVYSPLLIANTRLNYGNLEGDCMGFATPERLQEEYLRFSGDLFKVSENYGHLLDQDIIQNHSELWNMTIDDSVAIAYEINKREKYDILIENFNKDVMARKNNYKVELDKLIGNF